MKHDWQQTGREDRRALCDSRTIFLECKNCNLQITAFEDEIGALDMIDEPDCGERITKKIISA